MTAEKEKLAQYHTKHDCRQGKTGTISH